MSVAEPRPVADECLEGAHDPDAIDWDGDDPADLGPTWVTLRGTCARCGQAVHGYFDLSDMDNF